MAQERRNADGSITAPARAEGGGVTGDGMRTYAEGTPEWAEWDAWLTRQGR